ncbi:serine hydrolase domain-containing protein [Solidesulfovibrio alcoholivorans]|uniref:serine hydrolase domain-containing protein n=1 Tax=Solidesulfovibrio alcoholivorans TaxID=81406 RepID=UPI0006939555|nr:serine hydrolase domain-containing protein [Solidesulfovibrio alcoholivorans]
MTGAPSAPGAPRFHCAVVDAAGVLREDASTAIVPWWSVTKTLVAACVLLFAQEGRLRLDAPLGEHPFTVRQLLAHRSGLGDYGGLPAYKAAVARGDAPWSDAAFLNHVSPRTLLFAPGSAFAYSNVGYLLLRRRLEALAGEGLGTLLARRVLRPLGLAGSRLAMTPADMVQTAFARSRSYHPGWCSHGTVVGPVAEAALALHRLLAGELLSRASLAALRTPYALPDNFATPPWRQAGYALGLMRGTLADADLTRHAAVQGHGAGGPGCVGGVYNAPDVWGGRTVAVFTDATCPGAVEDRVLALLTTP